jgi:integrase/recombinase XerD
VGLALRHFLVNQDLSVIQQISGHRTWAALQKYLEVLDEDLETAVDTLSIL